MLKFLSFVRCCPARHRRSRPGRTRRHHGDARKTRPRTSSSAAARPDALRHQQGWLGRQAEWKAGQEARFKQLDTNKDGKLTQDELFARTPAATGKRAADRPPGRAPDRPTSSAWTPTRTASSRKAEFMAQADRNFARCDLDKDGRINTAECRQALQRRSTQRCARPATRKVARPLRRTRRPSSRASVAGPVRLQLLSACMTSPNSSQLSPLKRESWTAWIG